MKNDKLNLALASLSAFLLGITLTLVGGNLVRSGLVGAPSGPEIENYVPIIMQDNGYFSRKGIYTTDTLQADGATTLAALSTTGNLTVGSSGDAVSRINQGTCNIHATNNTITASTTIQVDCQAGTGTQTALTNLPAWSAGDTVFVTQSTSTPTTYEGLSILGANSSTTAGFITLKLFNGTGATFTWTAAASSTLQYLHIR